MTLLTTARCLAGCGVLAEGGWAATDAIAERHTTREPKHPTATETRTVR